MNTDTSNVALAGAESAMIVEGGWTRAFPQSSRLFLVLKIVPSKIPNARVRVRARARTRAEYISLREKKVRLHARESRE